jgi:act minimal PKS chain-length factor (CLF/KS beta)
MNAMITGIGVAAPTGLGVSAHWDSVRAGRRAIRSISRFDASPYPMRLAGEVPGFVPEQHVPPRVLKEADRISHLAYAACSEAMADARLEPRKMNDLELSVVSSNSGGGAEYGQRELQKLYREGPRSVSVYMSIAWFYAATTGQLSIGHGLRGHCGVLVGEQGGLDGLGLSRRLLRKGSRAVLAAGNDAPLCPYGHIALLSSGRLTRCNDVERAYQPFGAQASGWIVGEGSAVLVVESREDATRRGVERSYGRLAGYAASFDPAPDSGRPPTLLRAAEQALRDAELTPADIDAVFADGSALPGDDRVEADVIDRLFGPEGVPVTVPKTMTGRLMGAGPSLDVATALLAMRDQLIPPTVGVAELAPGCRSLDLVRDHAREARLRAVLVLARGIAGFNSAVVVTQN